MSEDDRWKGEVVSAKGPTAEEMQKTMEEVVQQNLDNFGYASCVSIPVHPLGHRDTVVIQGYSKEKANKIVLKMAKDQEFSEEDIEKLKENLEK